jgi:hypothetical protein
VSPAAALGAAGVAAGGLAALVGVGLLRRAWRRERPAARTLAGWAVLASAIPAWALCASWDKAVALALLAPSLAGYGLVLANVELRPARIRVQRTATELPDRSGEALWRALARTICAGPLAGAAAVLLSTAWVLKGLGSEADRTGAALLLAPALWGAGLTWATTDGRLSRIAGGLGLLALIGSGVAVL